MLCRCHPCSPEGDSGGVYTGGGQADEESRGWGHVPHPGLACGPQGWPHWLIGLIPATPEAKLGVVAGRGQ